MLLAKDLIDYVQFPDPQKEADLDGVVAMGGELNPQFLISAYRQGIFPWFNPEDPVMWWSPDPRCVLHFSNLHISKTLQQLIRQKKYVIKCDTNFEETMLRCQKTPRKHEEGTWISEDILRSYSQLHALGIAHSIEVYTSDNKLVGGLYGISIGAIFYGESMFASQANTSKIAFVFLTKFLSSLGFDLLDCQVTNQHLISLGCTEMSRNQFLKINKKSVSKPTIIGKWTEIAEKFGKDFVI